METKMLVAYAVGMALSGAGVAGVCDSSECQPPPLYDSDSDSVSAERYSPITLVGLGMVPPMVIETISEEMRARLADGWADPQPWKSGPGVVLVDWSAGCPLHAVKALDLTCDQAKGLVHVRRNDEGLLGFGNVEATMYEMTATAAENNLRGILGTADATCERNAFPPSISRGPVVEPVACYGDLAIVWAWMPGDNGAFVTDHPYLAYALRSADPNDETARDGTDGRRWSTTRAIDALLEIGVKLDQGSWFDSGDEAGQ